MPHHIAVRFELQLCATGPSNGAGVDIGRTASKAIDSSASTAGSVQSSSANLHSRSPSASSSSTAINDASVASGGVDFEGGLPHRNSSHLGSMKALILVGGPSCSSAPAFPPPHAPSALRICSAAFVAACQNVARPSRGTCHSAVAALPRRCRLGVRRVPVVMSCWGVLRRHLLDAQLGLAWLVLRCVASWLPDMLHRRPAPSLAVSRYCLTLADIG
ncbi:hypothetical protein BC831DRAFT_192105 [Entophlyctis helioformis]|nr:hypothetical protein BC831DRAFT_192105 [Entophlyctis helioformis]